MIRHIVMMKFNRPVPARQIEDIMAALVALPAPGRTALWMGVDLGLRAGNLDAAIVADFEDEAAFLAYDRDPGHDRVRREMIGPITERIERCQFAL